MKDLPKIIRFWGACDILLIAWWAGGNIIKGQVPVYFEINQALNTSSSFGNSMPVWIVVAGLLIYASIVYSGILFIGHNRKVILVSYIQTLFRIISGTPSLFFVPWIAAHIFSDTIKIGIAGIILAALCEILKLISIRRWDKNIKKNLITTRLT